MAANVESMFSANRIVPWHGLGQVIEEAPDSAAAIKLAGLDWEVQKKDIWVDNRLVKGYKANVRSDTGEVLGIVTDRYSIVQNSEAFSFTDALISEGEVRYETAGSLKNGRQVWLLAKMNREYSILGDKFDPYICFTNTHDGSGAVRVMMTPVRVVCSNTLNLAMRQASRSWGTRHTGDIAAKLVEAQRTLGLAETYMERLDEEANKLVDIKLSQGTIREIIAEVLPIGEKDSERKIANIMEKRNGILSAMKADDIKKFDGTAWQVINAVSDFVAHSEPGRRTANYQENQFANIVNGEKLFDKTYFLLRAAA